MTVCAYTCRGIRIRSPRRTAPPGDPEHALLFRALGGRADAPPSPAATIRLQAPQGIARRWLRRISRGGPAAGLSPQSQTAPGNRRLASALPPLLVEARRCAGATPGADGEELICERKEETWEAVTSTRRLAHLLRRAGSPSRRSADWTHRRCRCHEVRWLAAIERRVRKAVRRRVSRLADQHLEPLNR